LFEDPCNFLKFLGFVPLVHRSKKAESLKIAGFHCTCNRFSSKDCCARQAAIIASQRRFAGKKERSLQNLKAVVVHNHRPR
jgi:hypothetical protein